MNTRSKRPRNQSCGNLIPDTIPTPIARANSNVDISNQINNTPSSSFNGNITQEFFIDPAREIKVDELISDAKKNIFNKKEFYIDGKLNSNLFLFYKLIKILIQRG